MDSIFGLRQWVTVKDREADRARVSAFALPHFFTKVKKVSVHYIGSLSNPDFGGSVKQPMNIFLEGTHLTGKWSTLGAHASADGLPTRDAYKWSQFTV